MKNHYELLGVQKNASYADLKTAYRSLALTYHPDKNPGDAYAEELFKKINEAYQVVSDPAKRSRYDATLEYQQFFEAQQKQQRQTAYTNYDYAHTYHKPNNNARKKAKKSGEGGNPEWEKSLLNLSNRNFYIVLFLAALFVYGVIGLANYVQYQRDLEAKIRNEGRLKQLSEITKVITTALEKDDFETVFKATHGIDATVIDAFKINLVIEEVHTYMLNEAELAINERNYSRAINVLEQFFKHGDEEYKTAYVKYKLGISYYKNGQYDKVISFLENESNAFHPEIPTLIALVYRDQKKDIAKAKQWHDKAKKCLGVVYQNSGFDFVPSDAPQEHFEAYFESAKTNYNTQEYSLALDDLRGALFLRSNNGEALYYKAQCEHKLGKADACETLTRAIKSGYSVSSTDLRDICN